MDESRRRFSKEATAAIIGGIALGGVSKAFWSMSHDAWVDIRKNHDGMSQEQAEQSVKSQSNGYIFNSVALGALVGLVTSLARRSYLEAEGEKNHNQNTPS